MPKTAPRPLGPKEAARPEACRDPHVVPAEIRAERVRGLIEPAAGHIVAERLHDPEPKRALRRLRVRGVEDAAGEVRPPRGDRAHERHRHLEQPVEQRAHLA
jgi:hypothetical protein